jgi:dihydroneopterin aldolase/2-amino-4-hydroxy-6-hydroxymethyldihydropteridine diphosphokinase
MKEEKMDYIQIEQLEVFAYHGCNEEEKINGQKFYVDAKLYVDVQTPGLSDNLDETINYAKACKFINKFMTENRFDLIEAVAEQTSRALLQEFPKLKAVEFTINKPNAPIKLPFGNVAVSVFRKWNKAYLSIGSNMGNKEAYLNSCIEAFYDDSNCRVTEVSNFIETKPYGPVEQDNFLNGCIGVETLYSAEELLERIHEIEAEEGRTREIHWGPRTLDIDIVLFNDEIIAKTDLLVPHVEMHKRLFVL